jgi:hypothetical protein
MTYNMTKNLNVAGTCFNVTADNVTLDCKGYSIVGDNATGAIGAISYANNTIIRNCNISNFDYGVRLLTGNNSLVDGVNVSAMSNAGIRLDNTNSVVNNSIVTPTSFSDDAAIIAGTNNILQNSKIYGSWNSIGITTAGSIYGSGAGGHRITNNLINLTNTNSNSAFLYAVSTNSTFNDNTFIVSNNNSYIAYLNAYPNNIFRNNTLIATTNEARRALLWLDGTNNVTVCLNNFSSVGTYVNVVGSATNLSFDCTYDGKKQGNIWGNVENGSVIVQGSVNSSIAGLVIGRQGSGFPYNNITSGGKLVCTFAGCANNADNAPLTNQLSPTHYPFTTGRVSNTSVATTSATFADVLSFNFTPPSEDSSSYWVSIKTDHSQTGGSSQVSGYRVLVDGVVLGAVNSTNTNGATKVRFFQSNSFARTNATNVSIRIQHARVSGTGTMTTTFVDATVFGMRDLGENLSNDHLQYNISNTSSSSSFTKMFDASLNQTYAAKVVLLSSAQTVKTTTGEFQYYYNITYSNGTIFQCPTSKRYATGGATASPPSVCITPDDAPVGITNITMYALDTVGSTALTGKLHAFGYFSDETDCSDMTTVDGRTYNTSFLSVANVTINIDEEAAVNNHNIFAIFSAPTNGTAGLSSYALTFSNSTGEVPAGVIDSATYINSRTLATTNGVLTAMRDWRNVTGGDYTVYFNVSTATGTGVFSGGALMAMETMRVPNTPVPRAVSFTEPTNTTYYASNNTLNISYSSAQAQGGAAITNYNITLWNGDGTLNATLNDTTTLLYYVWNISSLGSGSFYVQVIATDASGFTSTSNSDFFTLMERAISTQVLIRNSVGDYVPFNFSGGQMTFRCSNPFPSYCNPTNQNNATGIPILVVVNNGSLASTYRQIKTNETWTKSEGNISNGLANLICGTTGTALGGNCYQESPNTTNQKGTDGNCNLNYTGNYVFNIGCLGGGDPNCANFIDGDWTTYSTFNSGGDINVTYAKPSYANNMSYWQIKASGLGDIIYNLTPAASCWGYSPTNISWSIYDCACSYQTVSCFNGTDKVFVYNITRNTGRIYDEAMIWNVNSTAINISTTFQNYSTATVAAGTNQSLYMWLYVKEVPANFPRTFNLTIENK